MIDMENERYYDKEYRIIPNMESDLKLCPRKGSITNKLQYFISKDTDSVVYIELEHDSIVDFYYNMIMNKFGGKDPNILLGSSGIHIEKIASTNFNSPYNVPVHVRTTTGLCISTDIYHESKILIQEIDNLPKCNFGITHYEIGDEDYIKYLISKYEKTDFVEIISSSKNYVVTYTNSEILKAKGIEKPKTALISIVLAAGEKFQL